MAHDKKHRLCLCWLDDRVHVPGIVCGTPGMYSLVQWNWLSDVTDYALNHLHCTKLYSPILQCDMCAYNGADAVHGAAEPILATQSFFPLPDRWSLRAKCCSLCSSCICTKMSSFLIIQCYTKFTKTKFPPDFYRRPSLQTFFYRRPIPGSLDESCKVFWWWDKHVHTLQTWGLDFYVSGAPLV